MALFVSSCVSHDFPLANTCNVANPIEELPWLKAQVADLNNSEYQRKFWYITQANYYHQTVFIVNNCCPNCLTLPSPVYACTGELLFRGNDERFNDVNDQRLLWKSDEYACTF